MIQARAAWKQMELNPTQEAAASYNLAASRLFDQLHCGQTDWYRKAAVMELRPTGLLIWMDPKSEKIVPSGHSLTGHSDTIQEILRILRVHGKKQ